MITRIRKMIDDREAGFTLIELLVVIIIIGILAAIAIPVFLNQRKKGYNSSIKSDLRTAAGEIESVYTDTSVYSVPAATKQSPDNALYAKVVATGFCLYGQNSKSDATGSTAFWYDSLGGGLLPGGATVQPTSGTCAGGGFSAAITHG